MSTKKLQILNSMIKQAENANTLGGRSASYFAVASEFNELQALVGDTSVSTQISTAVDSITADDLGVYVQDIEPTEAVEGDIWIDSSADSGNYITINHVHNDATASASGFMSALDKVKLDSLTELPEIIVDDALSRTSTNPVQNKVINAAISDLNTLVGDTAVSEQIDTAIVDAGVLTIDTTDSEAGTVNLINADTVGGLPADSFVLETEFDVYKNTTVTINKGGTGATTAANARTNLGVNTQAEILSAAYPVGSIYLSVNSTSPASLFGGTWEQLKDRFLLGAGDTYSNGAKGGAATVTLTIDQMPEHRHILRKESSSPSTEFSAYAATSDESTDPGGSASDGVKRYTTYTGGGEAHNNMPPYLTVYMWKRVS